MTLPFECKPDLCVCVCVCLSPGNECTSVPYVSIPILSVCSPGSLPACFQCAHLTFTVCILPSVFFWESLLVSQSRWLISVYLMSVFCSLYYCFQHMFPAYLFFLWYAPDPSEHVNLASRVFPVCLVHTISLCGCAYLCVHLLMPFVGTLPTASLYTFPLCVVCPFFECCETTSLSPSRHGAWEGGSAEALTSLESCSSA